MKFHEPIPADFPVQPLKDGDNPNGKATCGHCGLSWDDDKPTSMTPAPSARSPFEYFHLYPKEPKVASQRSKTHSYVAEVRPVRHLSPPMPFPLDMLRREQCWPRLQDDAINMGIAYNRPSDVDPESAIQVVKRTSQVSPRAFNAARWRSFGWEVVSVAELS